VRGRTIPFFVALAFTGAAAFAAAQQTALPPAQTPAPQSPPASVNSLSVVVIDPAHGGADPGARGSAGIGESEVVLNFARFLRIALEGQGLRVVLTREDNENPSFDDRSAIANGQHGAIFITLHVSSTGPAGTVRVYSEPAPTPPPPAAGVTPQTGAANPSRSSQSVQMPAPAFSIGAPAAHPGMVNWDHAQDSYLDRSREFAALLQAQMSQRFRGSPPTPLLAAVRQLRTVAAPAIAIEVSSVSIPDRALLDQMASVLADGVARAVADFKPIYEAGAK